MTVNRHRYIFFNLKYFEYNICFFRQPVAAEVVFAVLTANAVLLLLAYATEDGLRPTSRTDEALKKICRLKCYIREFSLICEECSQANDYYCCVRMVSSF